MASTRVVVLSSLLASCIALPLAAQVKTLKRLPAPAAQATAPGKDSIVVQGGRDAIVVQGGREAIGPKQDDPLATGDCGDTPDVLAIGPKQDDPRTPGTATHRPGDDEDPQARSGMLAIGLKQDDPRAPGSAVLRPGDDEDPQARCVPRQAPASR